MKLLEKDNTGLLIIDVQDKLLPVMMRRDETVANIINLIHLAKIYELPILTTEQYPKWLGSTVPQIKDMLPDYEPVLKMDFNCCEVSEFNAKLKELNLKTILLVGVEAHICVFQTAVTLIEQGFDVHVPVDSVTSRTNENKTVGLDLMKEAGAVITSAETVIYQIMKKAGTTEFKQMLKVVK